MAWLVAGALLVGAGGTARAQEEVVAAQPPPPPKLHFWEGTPPPNFVEPRLDERTALTLGQNKLKLGILAFGYGITDWLDDGVSGARSTPGVGAVLASGCDPPRLDG